MHSSGLARTFSRWRCSPSWLSVAVCLAWAASPLYSQTFEPSVTVGAGIQTSYEHTEPTGSTSVDQFEANHVRLYFSGDITKDISAMVNTDYSSSTDNMQILDAVGEFHPSPMFNVWFGRFLPPSDRANFHGPFYSNEWAVFQDGSVLERGGSRSACIERAESIAFDAEERGESVELVIQDYTGEVKTRISGGA